MKKGGGEAGEQEGREEGREGGGEGEFCNGREEQTGRPLKCRSTYQRKNKK